MVFIAVIENLFLFYTIYSAFTSLFCIFIKNTAFQGLDIALFVCYINCTRTLNTVKGGDYLLTLDYRDARPIYVQICDGIREQILTGILQEGDRLPSVRELATQLTINPNTIQRAYAALESDGWIVSVPGKGNFVGAIPAIADAQQKELWDAFGELCRRMERTGISKEEMIRRLSKGGNPDA